jgi:hypothetical protein
MREKAIIDRVRKRLPGREIGLGSGGRVGRRMGNQDRQRQRSTDSESLSIVELVCACVRARARTQFCVRPVCPSVQYRHQGALLVRRPHQLQPGPRCHQKPHHAPRPPPPPRPAPTPPAPPAPIAATGGEDTSEGDGAVAVAGRGGKEGSSPGEEAGGAEIVGNGPAGDDVAAEGGGFGLCNSHLLKKKPHPK